MGDGITREFLNGLAFQVRMLEEFEGHAHGVRLERIWRDGYLRARLVNESGASVRVREVALFQGVFPVPSGCPFYGEGFQMLTQYAGTLNAPRVVGKYGTDEEFFRIPKTRYGENRFTVYNCFMLSPAPHCHALLAFTSSYRYAGLFRFSGSDIEVIVDCEGRLLAPGDVWEFDEFGLFTGEDRNALFAALAKRLNENHPPLRYPEMPFGWCSYHCISGVRAADMNEQAQAMKERIPELRRIQIDAGYQSSSDWLIPNPHSGATMCDAIREIGVEPAGYLSPFIVEEDSVLFREHPDWLVCDGQGKPFHEYTHVDRWYMLDGSNPGAVDYIRHVVRTMHDDWGLRYFKLDFTSYGALPGGQRRGGMTRIEAFRALFGAIVEEIGSDSYILGCNAPLWAQLGLVHGNRQTNDVFRRWETIRGNAQEQFYRNWQNGVLWIGDPDGVVLEKRDMSGYRNGRYRRRICELSDAEFNFHKAYIVACGGVITSGDLLTEISEKNLGTLRTMMREAGTAAVFDDTSFTVGRIQKPDRTILCVFNWEDDVRWIEIPIDGECEAMDLFTGESLGIFRDRILLGDMLPHDARTLELRTR
ncbi:MAG TPA: alpha-galactosidase [Clostridia bacterium]|nr:alpha-galactosidase [Clostridia bacterium]